MPSLYAPGCHNDEHSVTNVKIVTYAVTERALQGQLFRADGTNVNRDIGRTHAHLDECAARLRHIDTGLDRRRCATGLDDKVDRALAAVRDPQLLHHLLRIPLRILDLALALLRLARKVHIRRGVLLRELEALGHDVDADDAGGTDGFGGGHAEEADGATAEDDDGLGGLELAELCDGVDADGEGLDEGAVFEGHVVGELVNEVGGDLVVAGESAIVGWCSGEDDVGAEVVVARLASIAAT